MDTEQKTPPHSAECERGILGSILLDTQTGDDARVLDLCLARGISAESFFDPRNSLLFKTFEEMSRATMPIDVMTLDDRLRATGRLDAVGGVAAIQSLVENTPTSAHAEYYIDVVRQKHLLRTIIAKARDTERKCFDETSSANADVLLGEVEKDFLEIGGTASVQTDWKVAVKNAHGAMERFMSGKGGQFEGLPTGFKYLDEKLCGLKPGDMIVVAARPSVGKTSLAMNIAECVAMGQDINGMPAKCDGGKKHPVLIFSLEMSTDALARRMLCGRAQVNSWRLVRGQLAKIELTEASRRLMAATNDLRSAPLYIDDTSAIDVMDMRARARRMKRTLGIELIVIDYLQLSNCREYAKQGRQLETSRISGQIKAMAKELKVPVIVISQLARGNEQRGDRDEIPRLSDLRDSGAIEQDADVVLLLRRPCRSKTAKWHENELLAIVDVAKHRNGETGEVDLNFYKEGTRFGDRPQNQRDVAQTDAETAEANAATAEEVMEAPELMPSPDMFAGTGDTDFL
jgi:replicative DNA helicase